MSDGKRPGGLTALAVLNFVFGGVNALGALGMAAILAVMGMAAKSGEGGDAAMKNLAHKWEEVGMGIFYLLLLMMAVSAFLLIASGVGYLKQKKTLGRTLGSAYAVLAIVTSAISMALSPVEAGGGFSIGTIVGLIYPVLTLVLLNGTFKHDFIH